MHLPFVGITGFSLFNRISANDINPLWMEQIIKKIVGPQNYDSYRGGCISWVDKSTWMQFHKNFGSPKPNVYRRDRVELEPIVRCRRVDEYVGTFSRLHMETEVRYVSKLSPEIVLLLLPVQCLFIKLVSLRLYWRVSFLDTPNNSWVRKLSTWLTKLFGNAS